MATQSKAPGPNDTEVTPKDKAAADKAAAEKTPGASEPAVLQQVDPAKVDAEVKARAAAAAVDNEEKARKEQEERDRFAGPSKPVPSAETRARVDAAKSILARESKGVGDVPVQVLKTEPFVSIGGRSYSFKAGAELEMHKDHAEEMEQAGWVKIINKDQLLAKAEKLRGEAEDAMKKAEAAHKRAAIADPDHEDHGWAQEQADREAKRAKKTSDRDAE